MDDADGLTKERLVERLGDAAPETRQQFEAAWDELAGSLTEAQLSDWGALGLDVISRVGRSSETAQAFLAASPQIAALMPFSYFLRWANSGKELCEESSAIAGAYFAASPGAMSKLRSRHIEGWAAMGSGLYKGTWKSSTLATKFFEKSPELLDTMTVKELQSFVALLDVVARRSSDLASECLVLSLQVFPLLPDGKEAFISLAGAQVQTNWRQVKALFDSSARALPAVKTAERVRFLALTDRLRKGGYANPPVAMLEISRSLSELGDDDHEHMLTLAERLLDISPAAVTEFTRSCPAVLGRITPAQLDRWFEEGVSLFEQNEEAGLAFFRVESASAQEMLEMLSSSVEFDRVKGVMEMYCCALAGAEVKLAASEELAEKNIGWVSDEAPSTEGSTVYVPSQVGKYGTKDENFALLKVVSTHQVAHLEFGSFDFEYERPSTLFTDLRPRLETKGKRRSDAGPVEGEGVERVWLTDMQRFFDVFEHRALALDVFTVVEDGRLDARVKSEYPGIRSAYVTVQRDALEGRPEIRSLPAREALVEFLVRYSLVQSGRLEAPTRHVEEARKIAAIARRVLVENAAVEDTAEATIRIYGILAQIPNAQVAPEDWEDVELGEELQHDESDGDLADALKQMMEESEGEGGPETEDDYSPSEDVDYRGDFKPELVQFLSQLRMQRADASTEGADQQITQEMLEEMLENSAELDLEGAQGMAQASSEALSSNMMKEAGQSLPDAPQMGQGPLVHVDEEGGALDPTEPQTFAYDEWDFRAYDYKPRWCMVRQKTMAEGDPDYYGTTLASYGPLASQIRRQFELLVPEMFRKVRKLEDGEEIDIDEVIEAFIDIRTGVGPSEKLFWRRNKIQRDVAVVFLLDTSASTAEAIEEARSAADDWEAPEDPVEYMVWLRNRRGEGARRSYKRIIDLEKEAVVLLIHALESIGDMYGIYGFSGYGRENVEFYTIKDIDETLSDRVKRRVDRIAPLHATRMGPAIRHATTKLEAQDARTKLLFLISDGRPQDRGYSREGVEKEYAVHDTKKALDEAKAKDVNAFCLTVDKNGHDYLKTMCADMGYEILDDIHELPRRLLQLYKNLTM